MQVCYPVLMRELITIAGLFVRLGLTAFGGPAAHIAMLEAEVVGRLKWMERQHFLDLMGATNLIPGPNSTEMVMHVGLHRAGIAGMVVAGLAFIGPAAGLTLLLAVCYVQYGSLPQVAPLLFGVKPAVLVLIGAAVYKLGKKALKH
ncbi:MAG: chromate transporter, partial [Bacteroidetes bacterium]